MPKNWSDITDDQILNFDGSQPAIIVRYERIMQKKSIDSLHALRDKLTELMEAIHGASQGLQVKTDELINLYGNISKAQGRQQFVLIALTVVIAISTAFYTWTTWQSVSAMREANEIQRQLLEPKK